MKTVITFIMAAAIIGPAAAQSIIYKCTQGGKTLYSESPCRPHAYQENRLDVNTDRIGTVDPDRETVEATRARIREGMTTRDATAVTTTTTTTTRTRPSGNDKEMACNGIRRDIENIESSQRQRNSPGWQDSLTKQKRDAQQRYDELGC